MSADFGLVSIKMVTSLFVIIGFILFVVFVLKKFRLSPLSNSRTPAMRVLGTLNIAPKRSIALVEICDQWFILGVGTENVTLISKIETPPAEYSTAQQHPPGGGKFQTFLENMGIHRNTPELRNNIENAKT